MYESGPSELKKHCNKKAKTGDLEGRPSGFPLDKVKTEGDDDDGRGGGKEADEDSISAEDPLMLFGLGIMMIILSKLDAHSLAQTLLVSREWLGVSSSDKIWATKCEELWQGKAHIPRISKARGISKMDAYSLSVMDAKRTRITRNDLCDHVWEYHFTEAAPEFWRNLDPHWGHTGAPLMHRYFHPDGSITADPNDTVWGGHESCYTVVTGLFSDGKIREHYVRINRWPQMSVNRKEDWGWELANHLYCYNSIPDPDKEDGTGPSFPTS